MRKFIIATHGHFASGIQASLDIIVGQLANVVLINAYTDGNGSIETELAAVLNELREGEELIVFTDLLGGSITNHVLRQALRPDVHVVAGFNLALLIEILMADAATPAAIAIETAITNAREQMVYVNKLIPDND